MKAFVFPGQGAQQKGMGRELFDKIPEFSSRESEIDRLLGYSVRKVCIEDPNSILKNTLYTQPCLFVVNALHYYDAIKQGQQPTYLAGHSLGEYNALLAAGAFDFLTGIRLVKRRAELMSTATGGSMSAVIGIEAQQIFDLLSQNHITTIDVANYNSPVQTVISGPAQDIQRFSEILKNGGGQMCIPLQVSAAFHSRYMASAASTFSKYLEEVNFSPLKISVIANVTGQPYSNDSIAIRYSLARQIESSVKWLQSIRFLRSQGVEDFLELGPGTVLTHLINQIN